MWHQAAVCIINEVRTTSVTVQTSRSVCPVSRLSY